MAAVILVLPILYVAQVWLTADLASANEIGASSDVKCHRALTIDERFAQLPGTKDSDPAYAVALTQLINEAWSPVLRVTAARLKSIAPIELDRLRQIAEAKIEDRKHTQDRRDLAFKKQILYRGRFIGHFHGSYPGLAFSTVPYVKHNRSVMRRLAVALGIVSEYVIQPEDDRMPEAAAFHSAEQLLKIHSFSRSRIREGLIIAHGAIGIAAGQLTATQVEGTGVEDLLRMIMRPDGTRASLMVRYALAMPPSILGPFGGDRFVEHPLSSNEHQLNFSDQMRRHFKIVQLCDDDSKAPNEFGHGCPVAHRQPGQQRSSLQDYLEAVMTIYDAI